MVEYNLKIWDLSATNALILGAGGAFQELGSEELNDGTTLLHAAFGKKRAVNLMAQALLE
jgi:fructose-1,6-bisphosphatase/inositol monophosphatase family enzyme